MSRATFAMESVKDASSGRNAYSGVHVSQPGDTHEREADRVADTVSRGGKVLGWSLSAASTGEMARQEAQSLTVAQMAGKVAAALMATEEGTKAIHAVTTVAGTPAGMVVTGATAAGAVAALADAKKPLPVQPPELPLDRLTPGLSAKVTYSGPIERPTGASVTLTFKEKSKDEHKKPATAIETQIAQGNAYAHEQQAFKANSRVKGPVVPQAKSPEQEMVERVQTEKMKAIGKPQVSGEHKKEEIPVHRKAIAVAPTGSADVDAVVRSSGRPLEPGLRSEMESKIGYDFSHVRVHTDESASSSARNLSARAYTVGSHVAFASGQYAPQSSEGRKLIAHELTHVVQQTSSPERAHPMARPAKQHVQRSWLGDLADWIGDKFEAAKNWVLGHLKDVPGYDLFCVLIGKDLVTGNGVERTPEKVLGAVLQFFHLDDIWDKLKAVGEALSKAFNWLSERLEAHHLNWDGIKDLLKRAWDAFEVSDLSGSWERIKAIFKEALDDVEALVKEIASKVLELVLEAFFSRFPAAKKIWPILKKAVGAIGKIAAHPLQFAETLVKGVKDGFGRFAAHLEDNLKEGLLQFVFQEVGLPDLKPPKSFDLSSMFSFALEVLGLTYARRREQLVKKLEPLGGEVVLDYAEKAIDIIQQVRTGGFGAIWQMIKDKLGNIGSTIFSAVRQWAITKIIQEGMKKIVALSNPVGEVLEVVQDIAEMVEFFIEKATQLIDMFEAMVNSFADMADGNSEGAAKAVEGVIKRSIPLILKFLANIFGFGDFGAKIRNVITEIREKIDDAIGKVLDFIVDKITPVWDRVKETVLARIESVKNWWTKPKTFNYGEEEHEITLEGDGEHPEVFVHSNKTALEHFLNDVKAGKQEKAAILKAAAQLKWRQGKQGEVEKPNPSEDAKGAAAYERLKVLMGKLKARDAPPSQILPQTEFDSAGGGRKAEAFLSTNRDIGSEPGGKDPEVWEDLGEQLRKEKSYVRGHLLSMRLGGQGIWANMMPITNKINQRMNAQVEAPLKKATSNTSRFYHYKVEATYDPVTLPPLSDRPKKKELYARGKLAEKRLKSLSWITEPADYVDGKWKAAPGELLDENGKPMPKTVETGEFTPPTLA